MDQKEKLVISDYFKELPDYKRVRFREKVKEELEISQTAFYNRLRTDGWKKIEREAVIKIINEANDA